MIRSGNIRNFATRLAALSLSATVGVALLAGCTQVREAEHSVGMGGGVPKGAEKLAVGAGRQGITTTANKGGTVFVNDEDTAEVVYSGKVNAGDQIVVDGKSGTVTVGQFKKDVKLNPNDTYAVYVH